MRFPTFRRMARNLPPITSPYDVFIRPLEWMGLRRARGALWSRLPEGAPGLEIGAGTGANLPYYPQDGLVVVTDVSPRAIRHVRRKRPSSSPPLVVADARMLPFRTDAFAWVAATLVFCEVGSPVAGLMEARRVLRRDGVVALLEHVRPRGVLGVLADALTRLTAPIWGEHFDRDTARNVELAGFAVERRHAWLRGGLVLLFARPHPMSGARPTGDRTL
ncbi:MAG: class I SAM-dependent methyltransferase [Gemmatimonadota bacterium]